MGLFKRGEKKDKSSAPSTANPYAQQSSPADPYTQPKSNVGYDKGLTTPTPGATSSASVRSASPYNPDQKSAGNASQYSQGTFGSDRYGNENGYSANVYGESKQPQGSRYGPSGYGGLGPTIDKAAADANREALFGYSNQAKDSYGHDPPPYGANSATPSARTEGSGQGYGDGAYQDRQLTAEEEEEEEVSATKQEIRFIKQSDVSATRNALRAAAQAEETGRGTLARIGAQGERIHNTEKNLDLTANHNSMAEDKAKELKRLNGSMFAIHPSNPFTASKRRQEQDAKVMERHRAERDQREASRNEAYRSEQRINHAFEGLSVAEREEKKRSALAERAKYQFEADDEDDELENEIDANLDALSGAASRLNGLAKATGQELDEQNRHLRRLNEKSTNVDDQIAMNRARLDRFK